MRREKIETPGYYEVALDRSGRGGRRIHSREVVKIAEVRRSGFYGDSAQYEVVAYRALIKGIVRITLMTRDVLRTASAEEVAKVDRNFAQAREFGWIDNEREDQQT